MKRLLLLTLLLGALGCNDRSIPTAADGLAAIASIEIVPTPIRVEEGGTILLRLEARDADGYILERPLNPSWRVGNPSLAEISFAGRLEGRVPGATIVEATLDGVTTRAPLTVLASPAAEIVILPRVVDIFSDEDTTLTAIVRDSTGRTLAERHIVWASSMPAVASVDSTGLVRPHKAGVVEIQARSGLAVGKAEVRIARGAPVRIEVEPMDTFLYVGQRARFQAIEVDAVGNRHEAVDATWSSDTPELALVTPDGHVRALAEGEGRIRARLSDLVSVGSVEIRKPEVATIDRIDPAPLVVGATGVIEGHGFSSITSDNTVLINGFEAQVVNATKDRIEFETPSVDLDACSPPVQAVTEVKVRVGDTMRVGEITHDIVGPDYVELERGESRLLGNIDCITLPTDEHRYLVTVYNTTPEASSTSSFQLIGGEGTGIPAVGYSPSSSTTPIETGLHGHILEQNERIARSVRPAAHIPLLTMNSQRLPLLGEQIQVHVPHLLEGLCSIYTTVNARVAFVGERAIILEDPDNPAAGQIDSVYQALGREFERTMWPIVTENFGNPLAYDAQLNADGRLYMFFTSAVGRMAPRRQLMGFVSTSDFSDPTYCRSSNQAEIFYAVGPRTTDEVEEWQRDIQSTIIHEVKHLASIAERYAYNQGARLEALWLEEASAMVAEEIWARSVFGYKQHGNTGYKESLRCELLPHLCARSPRAMLDHFLFLAEYQSNVEQRSLIGPVHETDASYYGSGWLFLRWAIDTYSQSEADFLSALIRTTDRGVDNLIARTGVPLDTLLGHFLLAMATDDMAGFRPLDPTNAIGSWNTRAVFAGANRDFPSIFSSPWPLSTRSASYGSFVIDSSVRGGTGMLLELGGVQSPPKPQVLRFLGPEGSGDLPPSLHVAVLRIQ